MAEGHLKARCGGQTVGVGLDARARIRANLRIVEGVDLVAGPAAELSAKPGATVAVPVTMRNAGRTVIDGAGLAVDRAAWTMHAGARHRNCRYDGERLVSCSFDQQLQPGTTYRTTLPYRLRGDTLAPVRLGAAFAWRPSAQHEAYLAEQRKLSVPAGTPGSGPLLRLEPVATATAKRQADVNYRDNISYANISVTGRNGADLVAVGAEVTAAKGSECATTARRCSTWTGRPRLRDS